MLLSASHFDLNTICGFEDSNSSSCKFTIWLSNGTCIRDIKQASRQKREEGGEVKGEHVRMSYLQIYFPADIKWKPAENMTSRYKALSSSRFAYVNVPMIREIPFAYNELMRVITIYTKLIVKGGWIPFKFYAKDKEMISVSLDVNMILFPVPEVQWLSGNEYIYSFLSECHYHN